MSMEYANDFTKNSKCTLLKHFFYVISNPFNFHLKFWFFLVLLFCNTKNINGQFNSFKEVSDSLMTESYHSLYTEFYNTFEEVEKSEIYATALLKKAYLEKDTLQLTNGYFMITSYDIEKYISLNDSLLKYSAFLSKAEHYHFSWYANERKGDFYYDKRDFKSAFDFYTKALHIAKKMNNLELQNTTTTNLGLLKERTKRNEEALIDFKKNFDYELNNFEKLDSITEYNTESLLNAFCLLGNSLRLNKKYDSAIVVNKKVFNYKKLPGANLYTGIAGLQMAEVNFDIENYKNVLDSINQSLKILIENDEISNIAVAYHLRGMSKIKLNLIESGLKDLEKMDSIFNLNQDLYPPLRLGFSYLINHFKKQDNTTKQLYYVQQLLKFDSIVYNYSDYISEGIHLQEKNSLLNIQHSLKDEVNKIRKTRQLIIWIGVLTIIALLIEIIRRKKKNKRLLTEYQNRFDKILNVSSSNSKPIESYISKEKTNDSINIAKSVLDEINLKIELFEESKGFLDKEISLNKLANDIGTNSNYLGKVIKYNNKTNFRQYINSLRIEYILNRIREDRKLIKYSIHAIAKEAGFNHAEPFSKAFKAKTGLYPSEFINKIKNQ